MKKTIILTSSIFISLIAFFMINTGVTSALSGSDFNAGRIIDDGVFFDSDSLTTGQIQNFLNAKVPECDVNGDKQYYSTGMTRKQWAQANGYPMPPYTCLKDFSQSVSQIINGGSDLCNHSISAGVKTAAQIIKDVSDACSINSKVLLVLLQKEQSLITDDWPWPVQYQKATGYGCPDTAPCDAEYFGFFNQVYNAAKAFRRYEANPDSYNYKAQRNNFIYYHPSLGACGGTNVFIQNQATANLYIYTPYQPNAAALNNLYGTGDSCSAYGNRNFWRLFNDWFGSTYTPSYSAMAVGQSSNPTVIQGQKSSAYIRFKNTGSRAWYDSVSAYANNEYPVRLGTDTELNRWSLFSRKWPHPSRASSFFGKIFDENGNQKINNHIVEPGQTAEFWFDFDSSLTVTPGLYQEGFRPIVEGHGPMLMPYNSYFKVKLVKANYAAEHTSQTAFPHLAQGQWSNSSIVYKNVGNVPWYDTKSSPGSNQLPVQLATDHPLNRASRFSNSWPYPHRSATEFATVYDIDGVSLASNQHIVQPGQYVKFSFIIQPNFDTPPGFYAENMRLVLQGFGPMNDTGTWLGVYVYEAKYTASFAGQSSFPTINKGSAAASYIRYRNAGNVVWYDKDSAGQNLAKPVKLATDYPLNRTSLFGLSWLAQHRVTGDFSKVYESDGVSLATNQDSVYPNQILEFSIMFSVPSSFSSGFFPEAFRPIVEGVGPMNQVGTWLGVTVP